MFFQLCVFSPLFYQKNILAGGGLLYDISPSKSHRPKLLRPKLLLPKLLRPKLLLPKQLLPKLLFGIQCPKDFCDFGLFNRLAQAGGGGGGLLYDISLSKSHRPKLLMVEH